MSAFASMTRAQLQAESKKRGVSAGGSNKELLARLEAHAAENDGGSKAAASSSSAAAAATAAASTSGAKKKQDDVEPAAAAAAPGDGKRKAADEADEEEQPPSKKGKSMKKGQFKAMAAAAAAAASSSGDGDDEPAAAAAASSSSSSSSAAAAAPAAAAAASSVPVVDLSGKRFVLMGGFPTGKFRIESAITSLGGEVTQNISKKLDYVICGEAVRTDYGGVSGPGSKKHKEAKKLKIPILDAEGFDELVKQHHASKAALAADINAGLIPDLANIVAGYADDDASSQGIGAQWAEILDMLGLVGTPAVKPPATEADITKAETTCTLAFPAYLKQLWRVSDGSGGDSEGHPRDIFPSVKEVVDLYTSDTPEWKHLTQTYWKTMKWLPMWDKYEAGSSYHVIDLRSELILCQDFDHEGLGEWSLAPSMTELVRAYHHIVKSKHDVYVQIKAQYEKEKEAAEELGSSASSSSSSSSSSAATFVPKSDQDLLRATIVSLQASEKSAEDARVAAGGAPARVWRRYGHTPLDATRAAPFTPLEVFGVDDGQLIKEMSGGEDGVEDRSVPPALKNRMWDTCWKIHKKAGGDWCD